MAEPYNTPVPGSTPRSGSPVPHPLRHPTLLSTAATCTPKPRVLHLGDPIRFNPDTHDILSSRYEVVRPSAAERERAPFIQNLRDGTWGSFQAIFRPFWRTGGEMGQWDGELIALLPESVRVFASAGTGYDWVDTKLLGEQGEWHLRACMHTRGSATDASQASSTAMEEPPRPTQWPTWPSP